MVQPLLHLQDICLTFGGNPLLEGAELSVGPQERLCLVGRNGSGKSTLLKIASRQVEINSGTVFVAPKVTVRYLAQEPDLTGHPTLLDYVCAGLGPGDDPHLGRAALNDLGLEGDEEPTNLSGGEARRAALARVLAPAPDVLLLDEPTNHLDLVAIEQLEQTLLRSRSAIVMISHDRRFLETLSGATVWLDRGTTRRLDQGFAAFEAWRDDLLQREEEENHKLARKIVREEHWIRYGVTARRKRNQRRLKTLHGLRDNHRERLANRPQGDVRLDVQEARSSGKLVIEAENLEKHYDARPIVTGLSLRIERGERIGLVGPNGVGKTTLIKLLTGLMAPDSGSVRLGTSLDIATLDQDREPLDPRLTLAEILTDGSGNSVIIGGKQRHVVGYMKDFLFRPEQARTEVGALSGGEKGRLMLARALAKPSNMLVLDEPTNDLDLETLDLLQEMLADYPGTLLLVSHDRDFIDRIATGLLFAEGDGRWTAYAGGYSDMVAQRRHRMSASRPEEKSARRTAAAQPKAALNKPKLTFKDQHALKVLPDEIEALANRIANLEKKLAGANFYATDPAGFATASEQLTELTAQMSAAEEQWLELELKRESLEGR